MKDEPTVWEYDGYNQKIDISGVHRTLRIGRDSSDFIAYYESGPGFIGEANVAGCLRAEGENRQSRPTHTVVHLINTHLFEPMSMREENWAESTVKNALRAGASKSSHAVVETEVWSVSFRGREGGMTAEQGEQGVINTIRAGQGGSVRPHVLISEGPVGTLTTDMGTKMQINNQSVDSRHLQVFAEGDEMLDNENIKENTLVVRRLTPHECELLMGWDPGWTEVGVTDKGELVQMADTHRYRMCGNGVVANVAEWLGVRYLAAKSAIGEDPKDSW